MPIIYEANGAFHLRIYSSVDIKTGQPNKTGDKGKPLRIQQSTMLARKDKVHTSEQSPTVLRLANAKHEQIKNWESAIQRGETLPDRDMTISDFWSQIYIPYIEQNKAAATIQTYKLYWGSYLSDHFASKTLSGYEPHMGVALIENLATKYSENTVSHIKALASAIFSYALIKDYITINPWTTIAAKVEKLDLKYKKVKTLRAYNRAEIERILDTLSMITGREEYNAELAAMVIAVCFYGGLRPSEAAGLMWENVDLNNGAMFICRAFVAGKHKDSTKTAVNRTVGMVPQLRNRFKVWHQKWHFPTKGLVFPNRTGETPVDINKIGDRIIRPALEKVGLEWFGMYACRRGYGTMMVNAGGSLEEASNLMGNSANVMHKHYYLDKEKSALAVTGTEKLRAALEEAEAKERSAERTGRKFREPLMLETLEAQ
jgi:integrase